MSNHDLKEKTRVHRPNQGNPIIEIGSDYFSEFLRFVADREGFADRSLEGMQIIVEGKPINVMPSIVLMVSREPNSYAKNRAEETETVAEVKPQVDHRIEAKEIKSPILGGDPDIQYSPSELAQMDSESFEAVCDTYLYTPDPDETKNDG